MRGYSIARARGQVNKNASLYTFGSNQYTNHATLYHGHIFYFNNFTQ